MDDNGEWVQVGGGYPVGQLARAFVTAATHESADTRRRAQARLQRWRSVLAGMADGSIAVGSRAPVAGLAVWATAEVVRGGFATGSAAAGGPLCPHELDVCRRAGVAPSRRSLFAYYLSDAGMGELSGMLDSGRYRVTVPEEAVLLTVAWLVRAGDRLAAFTLLDEVEPFAGTLRFSPVPADAPAAESGLVWRETAGEVYRAVAGRVPNDRIEANREALAVWNPFADDLLALWLETADGDGRLAVRTPPEWLERAAELLARYHALAAAYTRCSKHRRPKSNMAILRHALQDMVVGETLSDRRLGLLRQVVDAMVRRRGAPGSAIHTALRAEQATEVALPTHHALARVVTARLAGLPQDVGVRSTDALTGPVRPDEANEFDVPLGASIPSSIRRVVERAFAGTVEELIEQGVVPSAEVLARLVPQIAATTTTAGYSDVALRRLMAATYEAFRSRRSLLLLQLSHQVQLEELPWVAAVLAYRHGDDGVRNGARATLVRLGELAMDGFPATVLPNPLTRELAALSKAAGLNLPWVEELAADIFMGTFSAKFLQAAKLAGGLLRGSLYERYYGIDYPALSALPDADRKRWGVRTSEIFDELCQRRSGAPRGGGSVAANGMVIEQAQILTTHNLATLVGTLGVAPPAGWPTLARRSLRTACRLLTQVQHNPRPLAMIKDAAYAWRHTVFFLALADDQCAFLSHADEELSGMPAAAATKLRPVLDGLEHVIAGGQFDADGYGGGGRRFLGWAVGGHWMQPERTRTRH